VETKRDLRSLELRLVYCSALDKNRLRRRALSDNGSLTGRGSPLLRGLVCGVMTTAGGLGHALPYLIPDFWSATTLAASVVLVELGIMAAPMLSKADKADIEDVTHAGQPGTATRYRARRR